MCSIFLPHTNIPRYYEANDCFPFKGFKALIFKIMLVNNLFVASTTKSLKLLAVITISLGNCVQVYLPVFFCLPIGFLRNEMREIVYNLFDIVRNTNKNKQNVL